MTDEDIAIEYEAHLAYSGEELKTCPICNEDTHAKSCPTCRLAGKAVALSGDMLADMIRAKIEAGEDVDIDAMLENSLKG